MLSRSTPPDPFPEFRRLARRFDLNGAECIRADPHQQLSICRLRHVEAIQHSQCLVGLCSGDVRLPVNVLHHPRDEVQRVPVIMSSGIRNVENIEAAQRFLRGILSRIDRRGRFNNVDHLPRFLLVRKNHVDAGVCTDLHRLLLHRIESLLLYSQPVAPGGNHGKLAASSKVGFAAGRRPIRRKYENRAEGTATPFSSVTAIEKRGRARTRLTLGGYDRAEEEKNGECNRSHFQYRFSPANSQQALTPQRRNPLFQLLCRTFYPPQQDCKPISHRVARALLPATLPFPTETAGLDALSSALGLITGEMPRANLEP